MTTIDQQREPTSAWPRGRASGPVVGGAFALVLVACLAPITSTASAQDPSRIVSINACTDQLLLALADHDQIRALSRFAVDTTMSFYRDRVGDLSTIRGSAEEVLKLDPDLVVSGTFTRRETRERLAQFGMRVELFPPARDLDDVREIIARFADMVGHPERGAREIARLDAALARLRPVARGRAVLQLQRRGFISGEGTLFDDIIRRLGARNAAGRAGVRRVTLEHIVKQRPDLLVLFDVSARPARDQGAAFLRHPALAAAVPPQHRTTLPMNTVICGGPQVTAALTHLEAKLPAAAQAR